MKSTKNRVQHTVSLIQILTIIVITLKYLVIYLAKEQKIFYMVMAFSIWS